MTEHPRIEDACVLSVTDLLVSHTQGSWSVPLKIPVSAGGQEAVFKLRLGAVESKVDLTYAAVLDGVLTPETSIIALGAMRPHCGGIRWWLRCGTTGSGLAGCIYSPASDGSVIEPGSTPAQSAAVRSASDATWLLFATLSDMGAIASTSRSCLAKQGIQIMNARMTVRACVLALTMAALGGCATAYQSKGFAGGFSETLLSPDTFKINFSGNGFTSAERASDFAILRAADKSLEMGCNYFGVMSEADGASVSSATFGTAGWNGHHAWAFSNTVPVVKPNTNLFVKCYRDQQPGMSLFDAHFIAQSIRAKYSIKSALIGVGIVQATAVAATSGVPAAPVAMAMPAPAPSAMSTADMAILVRSAQQAASQQGCGDVHSAGGSSFKAQCSTFTLLIDCDGQSCRPVRTIDD